MYPLYQNAPEWGPSTTEYLNSIAWVPNYWEYLEDLEKTKELAALAEAQAQQEKMEQEAQEKMEQETVKALLTKIESEETMIAETDVCSVSASNASPEKVKCKACSKKPKKKKSKKSKKPAHAQGCPNGPKPKQVTPIIIHTNEVKNVPIDNTNSKPKETKPNSKPETKSSKPTDKKESDKNSKKSTKNEESDDDGPGRVYMMYWDAGEPKVVLVSDPSENQDTPTPETPAGNDASAKPKQSKKKKKKSKSSANVQPITEPLMQEQQKSAHVESQQTTMSQEQPSNNPSTEPTDPITPKKKKNKKKKKPQSPNPSNPTAATNPTALEEALNNIRKQKGWENVMPVSAKDIVSGMIPPTFPMVIIQD